MKGGRGRVQKSLNRIEPIIFTEGKLFKLAQGMKMQIFVVKH